MPLETPDEMKSPGFRRHSLRLETYDYAQSGAYFVTICVHRRECILGEVLASQITRSAVGRMVSRQWDALAQRFPFLQLDSFVVMPNHIHGVIHLSHSVEAGGTLGDIVRAFKSLTTLLYAQKVKDGQWPWPAPRKVIHFE